ncbi:hypothetical protein Dsin_008067 [Dipteronia sinensis]|uniref:Uncharacterized protein n=1 Tax=Dipteronia sinensis TaxID=43782 RepID=A0AAE0EJ26_9ROSI|nr:hypothetical protein Dsin_008067 [Dipteronia sinensis]
MWGMDVLSKGVRWRIGDGNGVSVYEDQWLPRPSTFKVCSPRWLPDRFSVSDLIDSPGKWNEPLIKRYFLLEEAELILSIPLSVHPKRDSVLWNFDRKGSFTVKSAYRVAISAMRSYEASCSSGSHHWWKKLWSLQLPNKIKIFCWRACHNILPTKNLLYRKGIIDSASCTFCAKGPETVDHALWGCKNVNAEWYQCPLFFDLHKLKINNFFKRVVWVGTVGNLECVTKFITTAWFVWNYRNQTLFGDKARNGRESWAKVGLFLSGVKVDESQAKVSTKPSPEIKSWSPPTIGTFKINVDVAMDWGKGRFGAGIIIIDNTGRILKAAALIFNGRVSVDIAKAKAIYEGLLLAEKSCLHPLVVESDSINIVRLCRGEIDSRRDVFNVINDIQILLARDNRTSISYISLICNRVAHEVARRAITLENSVYMIAHFPSWLQKLALSDVLCSVPLLE